MEWISKVMYVPTFIANDSSRERLLSLAAPKEQAGNGESLRQKYLYWTHLWRELKEPPKGKLACGAFLLAKSASKATLRYQGQRGRNWAPV